MHHQDIQRLCAERSAALRAGGSPYDKVCAVTDEAGTRVHVFAGAEQTGVTVEGDDVAGAIEAATGAVLAREPYGDDYLRRLFVGDRAEQRMRAGR